MIHFTQNQEQLMKLTTQEGVEMCLCTINLNVTKKWKQRIMVTKMIKLIINCNIKCDSRVYLVGTYH